MTDGCSVMEGKHSGVKKRLSEKISQLKDFGSCNDHHLGNAMEKGTEAFDEDVAMAAMNIYFDLGGAKGKGLKRKKEFEKVAEDKGIEVKAFKKLCSTRFRGIRLSLAPILHNWSAIISYYTSVNKPTDRQVVFGFKIILSVGINTHILSVEDWFRRCLLEPLTLSFLLKIEELSVELTSFAKPGFTL